LEITRSIGARLTYSFLDAEFETFEKGGEDLEGNEVPGLPRHQVSGELSYRNSSGLYAALELSYVSGFSVNDENSADNGAYELVDTRIGYEASHGSWLLSPFFGVRNLLDQSYNSNVRINANGGRYFEPGPGINVYGGIGISYRL